jgi:hypothetical protein
MHDPQKPSTPLAHNAFAADFLSRFHEQDEPSTSAEADAAGPWRTLPGQTADEREAHGVWRHGERPEWGDLPTALLRERALALLAAAVRPLVGGDALYLLGTEREPEGYPLLLHGEAVGWLDLFDEDWAFGINVVDRLTRSPQALAAVLEAAGPLALERVGRLLGETVGAS